MPTVVSEEPEPVPLESEQAVSVIKRMKESKRRRFIADYLKRAANYAAGPLPRQLYVLKEEVGAGCQIAACASVPARSRRDRFVRV